MDFQYLLDRTFIIQRLKCNNDGYEDGFFVNMPTPLLNATMVLL